jgi:hypothetical protein
MEEEIVDAVKVLHVSHAFSEIGTKQRPELQLIGRIDQL